MTQRHSHGPLSGTRAKTALLLAGLLMLVATAVSAASASASPSLAQESPRLASLDISIWPEFDRPATLVLLRGELSADVELPATVALRIPASSGGPSAVASAPAEGGSLVTRGYELTEDGDSLRLTLTTPDPIFQVEFYDPLATDNPDRAYTYVWPGDLGTDQLTVQVQEPAGSTGFSVDPDLGPGTLQPDGLLYNGADMGALESGQTLAITLSYRKTDPRTSEEILGATAAGSDDGVPSWLLPVVITALAVAALLAVAYWRSRRQPLPVGKQPPRGARRRDAAERRKRGPSASQAFCSQCGHRLDDADRFCSRCGAGVRGR